MMIDKLESNLLNYHKNHGVLICRECEYAIQKSAIGSHLLRHKVYRAERQRLLTSIARLHLLEPDDVLPLPPGSTPVDGLPVISGYKCTFSGCESLYASSKRMKRHWSEVHGVTGAPDSCYRLTNLQTFFRGPKLRYFEVALSRNAKANSTTTCDSPKPSVATNSGALSMFSARDQTHTTDPSCDLDLEALSYFHHFTTSTSLTLDCVKSDEPIKYWQVDVTIKSLQLSWLMCGLLALSASHQAVLSEDEAAKRMHLERSGLYLRGFSPDCEKLKCDFGVAELEELRMGSQMICIQQCLHYSSTAFMVSTNKLVPEAFDLRAFVSVVQGCADQHAALRFAVRSTEPFAEESIKPIKDIESLRGGNLGTIPSVLRDRLSVLPFRMAEVLEKPDTAPDFFATASAIEALVVCWSLSYSSDDPKAKREAMTLWLSVLPDHFSHMLYNQSYAALIVLAHWAVLVERVEHGCWFLKGSATKILDHVSNELPRLERIQSLIRGLINQSRLLGL